MFTFLVWLINKKSPVQICPICAGVTLTWTLLLVGIWLGMLPVARYELITAILMGASIGGIVNEFKKMCLNLRSKKKNEKVEPLHDKLKDCC